MKRPLGVILAGGQATRMGGGDKGLLDLDGKPILTHVVARLRPQVEAIIINANGDPARFDFLNLQVVPDSIAGFVGPLAGVLAGMDYAAEHGFDSVVTVAADTPFFPADLVDRLLDAARARDSNLILAATPDETRGISRHPTFGLWPVGLREDLRKALERGIRKVVVWTGSHNGAEAMFATTPNDPFFNVNTPEDLIRARAMMAKGTA